MSASRPQLITTRSKITSALSKIAPKARKQASKASTPKTEVEQEFKSATSEDDVASILGHPITSTLRIFNTQRSNKMPLREPAGFPVNQNFSQRVIYEFVDDEENEAIFLTPYMRPSHVLPTIALLLDKTKDLPLKGSIPTPGGETSSFRLGRTTRGFPTWRHSSKPMKVSNTNSSIEGMTLRSHSDLPCVMYSSMGSPARVTPIQVDAWSPRTPYKLGHDISNLITPGLSYFPNTPSTVKDIPTSVDSTGKALEEKTYFTRPLAQSSIPFPTSTRPMPSFSRHLESNPLELAQSVTTPSSYGGQRNAGYRPLGSEMLDTLDFLSQLCKRPEVLASDGDSILDGEIDDDGLMSPFYHAF